MPSKFVLRFDDIAPGMDWEKFAQFETLAKELDISLLLGVVPDCRDKKLSIGPQRDEFWDAVRGWARLGWTIAQHGYTHQYVTKDAGIFGVGRKSEFAGRASDEQFALLAAGKKIMCEQGVWHPVFMAPGHSLDMVTVEALAKLGFKYLTDGYGAYPYKIDDLVALPQLFSAPIHFGFGVYTICLHVNNMSNEQISKMLNFLRMNSDRMISFDQAVAMSCKIPGVAPAVRLATSALLRTVRNVRYVGAI